MSQKLWQRKIQIEGRLYFATAFHIGSGREGELATDMGVLRDWDGRALVPGSSLKGNFRAMAERLAPHLGLRACCLDSQLSGVNCVTDETYRRHHQEAYQALRSEREKLDFLAQHTCDVCHLCGSPWQAARIFFRDAELLAGGDTFGVRDGVVLDRDAQTARHGLKYDFEVANAGAVYRLQVDLENPTESDLCLVAAVVQEWQYGFRLGGFTSRGLGRVTLNEVEVSQVDYSDPTQLRDFLLARRLTPAPELLTQSLQARLEMLRSQAC